MEIQPEEHFQETLQVLPEAPPQQLAPVEMRIPLFQPPSPKPEPPVTPQKRTPSQSPLMPRKQVPPAQEPAFVATKKKPTFEKVHVCCMHSCVCVCVLAVCIPLCVPVKVLHTAHRLNGMYNQCCQREKVVQAPTSALKLCGPLI